MSLMMDYWKLFENYDIYAQRNMTPKRIKAIRRSYALTQVKFSELLGINYETLRKWEKGERYPSSPGCALLVIAEASPEEFIRNKAKFLKEINRQVSEI
jgi:DNA-binding transcriptional regulator YiaG